MSEVRIYEKSANGSLANPLKEALEDTRVVPLAPYLPKMIDTSLPHRRRVQCETPPPEETLQHLEGAFGGDTDLMEGYKRYLKGDSFLGSFRELQSIHSAPREVRTSIQDLEDRMLSLHTTEGSSIDSNSIESRDSNSALRNPISNMDLLRERVMPPSANRTPRRRRHRRDSSVGSSTGRKSSRSRTSRRSSRSSMSSRRGSSLERSIRDSILAADANSFAENSTDGWSDYESVCTTAEDILRDLEQTESVMQSGGASLSSGHQLDSCSPRQFIQAVDTTSFLSGNLLPPMPGSADDDLETDWAKQADFLQQVEAASLLGDTPLVRERSPSPQQTEPFWDVGEDDFSSVKWYNEKKESAEWTTFGNSNPFVSSWSWGNQSPPSVTQFEYSTSSTALQTMSSDASFVNRCSI